MSRKLETAGRRLLAKYLIRVRGGRVPLTRVPPGVGLRNILLMRWDAIGDMMVCLPYFRKVRELFPEARVGIVVSRRNGILLSHDREFHTILYDSSPYVFLGSLRRARNFKPDAVVDTRMHYDSTTSFIYGVFSGARWTLSAENRDNRLPFSVRVPMPAERTHNADMTRILLEGLGKDIDDSGLDRQVRLSAEEREFADAFWRGVGLGLRNRLIAINMSARDPLNRWPAARVEELCVRLLERGQRPLLMSVPSEREGAAAIAARLPAVITAPECSTILHAAALLRDIAMFITPDTGLVHLASSYDIPVVGLYRSNEEHLPLWFPWRVESEVLMDPHRVGNIQVDEVMRAVKRLAERTAAVEME